MARAAQAAANAQGRLLNVGHRHLSYSAPCELRGLLFENRKLLALVARAAAQGAEGKSGRTVEDRKALFRHDLV